jgi:Fur family ferric uptake transcriptional regulator
VGSARLEEIESALRAAGKRVTAAKRAVAQVLIGAGDHLSAEEVTREVQHLREVGASSVYRILEEFEELGLALHAHLGPGAAVYHLVGPAHGHLVCEACGATLEVAANTLDPLGRELRARYGFSLDRHHVALSGLCAACAPPTEGARQRRR